ncbi:uncharacterized protein LOC6557028 [Drosophila grimshawi]|uniref:GH16801 n=1 Tax=Drosophila grimshawi TaxID=7222 RepID=B4IWT0_DROGR|nr:uncharacterized protein LOC6557028 [Drosophila grimshawi]EDV97331.1 GH16801 [Drosophila grimshawi]
MFDKLNDDCWLKILKYVDLQEQLSLAQISNRMSFVVRYHWKQLTKACLNNEVLQVFEQQPDVMHDFLESASGSLQHLVLKEGTMGLLESWKSYSFPKLATLHCDYRFCNTEQADKNTLLLTALFPHVTNLLLLSSTSGRHLWNWYDMHELDLMCCDSLDTSVFDQVLRSISLRKLSLLLCGHSVNISESIFSILHCANLEELIIDDHHLLSTSFFLPKLLQLPRLRRFSFNSRNFYETLLQTVIKARPGQVKSLLFNDAFWNSTNMSETIQCMSNLRCLALQYDDIVSRDLFTICAMLPRLEELHLMNMRSLPMPTQLWNAIAVCKSLKVLNLSGCQLDEQFLDLSPADLDMKLCHQSESSPITLHVHKTNIENSHEKICAAFNHPNLRISFKAVDLIVWSSRFVEIEFFPSIN